MKSFLDAVFAKLERIALEGEVVPFTGGTLSLEAVETLEQRLGVRFPESYRTFLTQFGMIVTKKAFLGLMPQTEEASLCTMDCEKATVQARKLWNLPHHFVVVLWSDSSLACLDTSHFVREECSVVKIPIKGKDLAMDGVHSIAATYSAFLLRALA